MTTVRIQRAGPILDGKIDFSPLTILSGPNGSGKSYAAMILHSLSNAGTKRRAARGAHRRVMRNLDTESRQELEQIADALDRGVTIDLSDQLLNRIIKQYFEVIYKNQLTNNLESVFAADLEEIIKNQHRILTLSIRSEIGETKLRYASSYESLKVWDTPNSEPLSNSIQLGIESKESQQDRIYLGDARRVRAGSAEDLLRGLFKYMNDKMKGGRKSRSFYLPAGRAGLLQSHGVLTAGAFDRLSRVGLEPMEIPAFSGVVSGYLSQVVELSSREEGPLSDLSYELEENTLDGQVQVKQADDRPHPKITFRHKEKEYQQHLTSTSVSELAPLILYTRYILDSGSTVIIEEPEAHLHPENQRQVAHFIVKLVKRGVQVVVTTHSDFFVDQINNCIRVSNVDDNIKKGSELKELPEIKPSSVSVHVFQSTEDDVISEKIPAFNIKQVDVSGLDGITTEEFDRVSDELYGEAYKVDRMLEQTIND